MDKQEDGSEKEADKKKDEEKKDEAAVAASTAPASGPMTNLPPDTGDPADRRTYRSKKPKKEEVDPTAVRDRYEARASAAPTNVGEGPSIESRLTGRYDNLLGSSEAAHVRSTPK